MVKLIKADFDGHQMQFNDAGWFNATDAASKLGKRPNDWLAMSETQAYISRLSEVLNTSQDGIISTKKGRNGGTWLHPKLAVPFARWCSVDFAIWCDSQIEGIIHGNKPAIDWNMERHASKSSNKVANEILQMVRREKGKETAAHHYSNEARLVNFALTGEYKAVDRDTLPADELKLLASLENRNSVLIGRDVDRETRKEILVSMANAARVKLIK